MSAMSTLPSLAPVVASWMVITVMVTATLALLAAVAHHCARGALPTRLVWSGALLMALVLCVSQPWRRTEVLPPAVTVTAPFAVSLEAVANASPLDALWHRAAVSLRAVEQGISTFAVSTATATASRVRQAPPVVQWALVLLWPLSSFAMLVLCVASYRRQRTLLQQAALVSLHNTPVRVSAAFGPAVFGAVRPRIVVPHWLLQRTNEEQWLVVQHEQAHIAARDPLLLLTGCAVVCAMPWNVSAWYLLSRLRLAIELDCDARVLSRGASRRRYGQLLIDLSAAPAALPLLPGTPAFSYRASHLERRLRTMTARPVHFRTARRFAATTVVALATLAACRAELPTSAELQGMDVMQAERRVATMTPAGPNGRYFVDGKEVSRDAALALTGDKIATLEIRQAKNKTNEMYIATRDAGVLEKKVLVAGARMLSDSASGTGGGTLTLKRAYSTVDDQPTTRVRLNDSTGAGGFDGLVIIDNVRRPSADLNTLNPAKIASVEVLKSEAAIAQYGNDGAKGVIKVTTRK